MGITCSDIFELSLEDIVEKYAGALEPVENRLTVVRNVCKMVDKLRETAVVTAFETEFHPKDGTFTLSLHIEREVIEDAETFANMLTFPDKWEAVEEHPAGVVLAMDFWKVFKLV